MATKICEFCDQTIGETEKVCPKCGTDLEALEEEVTVVTRAQAVAAKRAAKKKAEEDTTKPPVDIPAKRSIFSSLNRKKG